LYKIGKSACYSLLLAGALLTGACSLTDVLKGGEAINYTLNPHAQDKETGAYLEKILEERTAEQSSLISDEAELRERQQTYIANIIQADLLKALYAKGYYDARIRFERGGEEFSGTYNIHYGPKFSIASILVRPGGFEEAWDDNIVGAGDDLDAEKVLTAQHALYNNIQKDQCYFNLDVKNEVFLNRPAHNAKVDFVVDAGAQGNFGAVKFQGNENVRESYLRKLLPWRKGECFRREKLESYKTALLQSGLFARAETLLPEAPNEDGTVDVTIDLRERAQRSISAGLTYYSDEGPGAVFGWEHRNFMGEAEKLSAALTLNMLKQSLDIEYGKPYFLRKNQSLSLNTSLRRQDTDAYEELRLSFGGAVKRSFNRRLSGSFGADFALTQIEDSTTGETRTFGLLSAPQSLTYDSRDDKLDPHKGWNATLQAEPFIDTFGESSPFIKTEIGASHYLGLGTGADLVFASKAGLGTIWGTDLKDVPATERFYAGGGGSVRGFGYQEVGPQRNGDPTGGRSLVHFSLEMRGKFTEKFGAAAFVDGANVSEESMPEFNNIAIGAGIGLRYYTGFGPLRFDIATPLTQKDNVDRNYQFYISIGQAF